MDLRPSSVNSSISYAFTYDVFLSFRGSDTRHGFTGNLYKALCDKGIHTFIDDEKLQRGDEITPSLMEAIEKSRIAIPVFSINYASSSFCLDELANIMKRKDILVLPIFYNVDPSDVRHQKGSYGKALAYHEQKFKANKEKLEEWKMALRQAANLSGYHFEHGKGYDYEFIGKIVNLVSSKINRTPLHVADYPVGLESQIQEVKKLLDVQPDKGANMVGIHGPGGMGKTTLAVAIYNLIADHFDSLCFLQDVRANSKKHGLPHLQSILLSQIVTEKEIKLASVKQGMSMIKHRLQTKKVLLIIDDVDNQEQLKAIVGGPDWFGPGSIVIITTRDKHLLAYHKVEKTFEVKELNKEDAIQLLRWKAFKSEQVDSSYVDVLNRAVTYASGLPLALEVIGSSLYKKSIEDWDSALNEYARIPNNKILEILKISYDALEEEEKNVFLDIACCFKGYHLEEVNEMLCAHYSDNMKYHIGVLVDKSLIKIVDFNDYEVVTLHDLIEEMGKEIVRRESPKKLEKRSRLWFHKDVVQVLKHNKGSNKIEIIFLQFPFSQKEEEEEEQEVKWDGDAFKKMKNLKTLIIKNGYFSQGPNHLPNSLKVLEWNKYPSKDLPSDFCPKKLVICKLPNSCFSSLELIGLLSRKEFVSVTNLNFNRCNYLTQIPDVSCLEHLETLSFICCENLCMIHPSVGSSKKLKSLNAFGCKKLTSFPPLELTSLEMLILSSCDKLESFPEISVKMENIRDIELIETPIKEFPRSFRNLTQLTTLDMHMTMFKSGGNVGCSFIQSIVTMPELTEIIVEGIGGWVMPKEVEGEQKVCSSNVQRIELVNCYLTDEFFVVVATLFANVKELFLMNENFTIIPECIKECHFLEKIQLYKCLHLQEIRGIPPNLTYFSAIGCPKMTASCRSMLLKQELHQAGNTEYTVPLTPIPEWFKHRSEGTSLSFWFRNNLPELVLCLSLKKCLPESKYNFCTLFLIINGIQCSDEFEYTRTDYTFLFDLNRLELNCNLNEVLLKKEWNFAEVCFETFLNDPITIRDLNIKSGIHVLKRKGRMVDIRLTDPRRKRKLKDFLREKHKYLDMDVSGTQIVQQQHTGFLSHMSNQAPSLFPLQTAFAMLSLDDATNEDSRSLVPMHMSGSSSDCQRKKRRLKK